MFRWLSKIRGARLLPNSACSSIAMGSLLTHVAEWALGEEEIPSRQVEFTCSYGPTAPDWWKPQASIGSNIVCRATPGFAGGEVWYALHLTLLGGSAPVVSSLQRESVGSIPGCHSP